MNGVSHNGIKRNMAVKSIFYKLITCLVILTISYGCAGSQPAIIKAASSGDINAIKKMRAEGQNINERDSSGSTALINAICNGKTDAAKYLIESGADITAKDKSGGDALIYAVTYGQIELVNSLLDRGANIESKDWFGTTPVINAIKDSVSIEIIRLLIKRGANLNVKDAEGYTPLAWALFYKRMDVADEIQKAMTDARKNMPSARIVFIRESNVIPVELQDVPVYIDEQMVANLGRNSTSYFDVSPGKCTMVIKGGKLEGNHVKSFDAVAGKTYYFLVTKRVEGTAAGLVAGAVGQVIESQIMGEEAGPFKITPLEASVAKEKIQALLKTSK